MRHFTQVGDAERQRLFFREPEPFGRDDDPLLLATALGGTLYSPANRPQLARDVVRQAAAGVTSMVLCLEDSIADAEVQDAERNLVAHVRTLAATTDPLPLLFVRVRSAEQITHLVNELGRDAAVLSGFVIPKFLATTGPAFLDTMIAASHRAGQHFWAMPVLESCELVHLETRRRALARIKITLSKYRANILAVRLGGTDMSSCFGLRRSRDLSIYDVQPVASAIGDIINTLGRPGDDGFVVTAPVWEYYPGGERLLKPQLRASPFVAHHEESLRRRLLEANLDGLIREMLLDQANGLIGKTVIHPVHVAAVHALSSPSHEEYLDAQDVLAANEAGGGASASSYRNKMNEGKPHHHWALRTLRQARVFGVTNPEISAVDLLASGLAW